MYLKILPVLFILLVFLLFSMLTIKLILIVKDKIHIELYLYFNGIVLYKRVINITLEDIIKLYSKNYNKNDMFLKYNKIIKTFAYSLLRKINLSKFSIVMNIGLYDAALTSIVTGILWNVMTFFLLFLKKYIKTMGSTSFYLYPQYNTYNFDCYAICIIKIRIGHIISQSIKGYIAYIWGDEHYG